MLNKLKTHQITSKTNLLKTQKRAPAMMSPKHLDKQNLLFFRNISSTEEHLTYAPKTTG